MTDDFAESKGFIIANEVGLSGEKLENVIAWREAALEYERY